jgi:hypothetical protein
VCRAHRAANPEEFPLRADVKEIYPPFWDVKDKMRCTPVHIQIYDGKGCSRTRYGPEIRSTWTADAAHILPILFPFTTPGKFCIRAIATFVKQVASAPSKRTLVVSTTSTISSSSTSSLASFDSQCSNTLLSEPASAKQEEPQEHPHSESKRQIMLSLSHAAAKLKGRSAQMFQFRRGGILVGSTSPSGPAHGEQFNKDHSAEYIYAGDRAIYNIWVC